MPNIAKGFVRIEVQLPEELNDAFLTQVELRERNAWIVYLLSKWLKVPYKPRKRGRPPKKPQ